jgi:AraC-like DNA-binding protein
MRVLQKPASAAARQSELIDLVAKFAPTDGEYATAIPQLHLYRVGTPVRNPSAVYEPCLCVSVQGSKKVILGRQVFRYDPLHYLLSSVTLPVIGEVAEASAERPYLCARLDIDPKEIGALMLEAGLPRRKPTVDVRGIYVSPVFEELLDAVLRLLRLLLSPKDAPVLAPLALREIYYRVLTSELGPRLRELALDSQYQRIARAVDLVKRRFADRLRIQDLADEVHMSPSSLYHRFKAVTNMSPLKFQKQLRLHEARRLMLVEGLEAVVAGERVGYESASQFSREYRRLFGAPPRQEIARLRNGN